MRKFWKLGLIFGIVAFMAGCSNLWDYVPPPRVNNPPPTSGSSGGGGKPAGTGPGPTRNVLTFYVDDGNGGTKTITVPKSTPDATTASIDDIKKAFGNVKVPTGFKADSATWLIKSDSSAAGASITGGETLKITFTPEAGKSAYSIDTSNGKSGTGTKNVAKSESEDRSLSGLVGGQEPQPPAGYTFTGWDVKTPGGVTTTVPKDGVSGETTNLDSGTAITANFEKDLNFYLDQNGDGAFDDETKTIKYPEPESYTLKDIFKLFGINTVTDQTLSGKIFGGWEVTLPDGTTKIVSSADINAERNAGKELFPAGTKIAPKWVANGEGGAAGDPSRSLSAEGFTPSVGDYVTDEAKIFKKGTPLENIDGKILGYIYEVDTSKKIVNVVAKDIRKNLRWSSDIGNKVYNGYNAGSDNKDTSKPHLYQWMVSVESGYDAWTNRINSWNTTALYKNYQAIKVALCYPLVPPSYDTASSGWSNWLSTNNDVDKIVNGSSVESRWYLPSVEELKKVYTARAALKNWNPTANGETVENWGGPLIANSFWSVNVAVLDDTAISATSSTQKDNWAQYVEFTANDGANVKEANKYSGGDTKSGTPQQSVLAVSTFYYKVDNVNH